MKKQILATAIATTLSVSAYAEPTIYGKANISLQSASEYNEDAADDVSATELVSNASRIGVKGNVDLENGLTAIYKAEYETFYDDGEKDENETFSQRNIYVGLKGGFGTVKAGKFDTPLKTAQNKIDLFNDLEGDIKAIITENDIRASNIVSYQTPAFSGLTGTLAFVASEEEDVDDGKSISLNYERDEIYVAVAMDQDVVEEGADVLRVVAQYKIGDLKIGALYEDAEIEFDVAGEVTTASADATFVSLAYTLDKFVLKGQFGNSDIKESEGSTLSVGVDYKLADKVKVYAYHTNNGYDVADALTAEVSSEENTYTGVGVEVKF